jgi:hypothetical protein
MRSSSGTAPDKMVEVATVRESLGIRPGGFGIAMTQTIADDLIYNQAQNEVVFIKYLSSPQAEATNTRSEKTIPTANLHQARGST